jgi:hypothetical protein
MLAAHQPFELGNARVRLGECRALLVIGLQWLEPARARLRSGLAVQPLGPMGLSRLDPVVQELAQYPKLAGHRRHA